MANTIITRLALDTAGFAKKLDLSASQVRDFDRKVRKTGKGIGSFFKGSLGAAAGIASVAGAGLALGSALSNAVQYSVQLEKKMSELRSLTGLFGDDLKYLEREALAMSGAFGVAADEVVEAMKNIGGARPELLKFKEGLAEVTRQSIILSQASGLSVQEAGKAVTGALNQFNEGAWAVNRFTNVLAAGAQAGAAEIPYLTQALERAGGVASSFGISFEEAVALVETIAPKFSSAEEAGTALKNMLLGLEKQGGKVSISQNGIVKSLEAYMSTAPSATKQMSDFGKSGLQASLALQANLDKFPEFLKAIKGTNSAQEQAKINTDNVAGAMDVLRERWNTFIEAINGSNGIIKGLVDILSSLIEQTSKLFGGDEYAINKARRTGTQRGFVSAEKEIARIEKYPQYRSIADPEKRRKAVLEELIRVSGQNAAFYKRQWEAFGRDVIRLKEEVTLAANPHGAAPSGDIEGLRSAREKLRRVTAAQAEHEARLSLYRQMLSATTTSKKTKEEEKTSSAGTPTNSKTPSAEVAQLSDVEKKMLEILKSSQGITDKQALELAAAAVSLERASKSLQVLEEILPLSRGADRLAVESEIRSLKAFIDENKKAYKTPSVTPEMRAQMEEQARAFQSEINKKKTRSGAKIEDTTDERIMRYVEARDKGGRELVKFGTDAASEVNAFVSSLSGGLSNLGLDTAGAALGKFTSIIGSTVSVVQTFISVLELIESIQKSKALLSFIPGFATGGIVGGTSFSGDKLLARVNSGEMILTRGQQTALFRSLSSSNAPSSNSVPQAAQVELSGGISLSGEKLYIALSNYIRRTGRNL